MTAAFARPPFGMAFVDYRSTKNTRYRPYRVKYAKEDLHPPPYGNGRESTRELKVFNYLEIERCVMRTRVLDETGRGCG